MRMYSTGVRLLVQTLFMAACAAASDPASAQWVINEILADPGATTGDANGDGAVSTTQDEFVEIVNISGSTVDIGNWTVADAVGTRHTFPLGTLVANGCAVVVFGGGTPTGTFGGATVQVASSGTTGFNNGGDTVTLRDGAATVMATYTYGAEGGNDQSITRDPDVTGTDPLVHHSGATGAAGTLFSPGTRIDGTIFSGCTPGPSLSIDDVSLGEGDAGPATMTFTVTLANGDASGTDFTVDFATQASTPESAVAGSDYVATSGQLTFDNAAASETQTIAVTINGDTAVEGDETFEVVLSGPTGAAAIGDGTGVGTILNDDLTVAEIWEIQGNGSASPMLGLGVEIPSSIVTAVAADGFYLQTPDARSDADAATSDGIFVYTGGAPGVAIGDAVAVTGTVAEFFSFTEISPTTGVIVESSGNPLPTAIEFSTGTGIPAADPDALSCPDSGPGGVDTNFECFEGMLIGIPEGVVTYGNRRRTGDDYAEVHFTPFAARGLREPGARFGNVLQPENMAVGLWDGNPETLEMDADALGAVPASTELVGGARFTNAQGVLAFSFGDYVFLPTALEIDPGSNVLPRPVLPRLDDQELTIASFNVLRLCDDVAGNTPSTCGSPEPDSAALNAKLGRLSAYVRTVLLSPDVVGVQEVENLAVLQALATRIGSDGGPAYSAHLVEGNDVGGIDVGFLTRDDRITVSAVTQLGGSETWDDPSCSPCAALLHDRPPLVLEGEFTAAPGAPLPFIAMNNHTRSRGGVDSGDQRVRAKRYTQARSIADMVQALQADPANAGVPLVLVGDYNAYQFSDGYADVVGMVAGTYVDAENTCAPSNGVTDCKLGGPNPVDPPLFNAVLSLDAGERYSFIFVEDFNAIQGYTGPNPERDVPTGQVLDHVLLDASAQAYFAGIQFGRANIDASVQGADVGSGPAGPDPAIGSSDHDGLVVYLDTDCTGNGGLDADGDGICALVDNCPDDANADQSDRDSDGSGDVCDYYPDDAVRLFGDSFED